MRNLLFLVLLLIAGALTAQKKSTLQSSTFNGLQLRNIGPALMSGRIADVAKDPKNPSTWYVATASGNVWKTINNATTWTPIFEKYGSYSTGAIAIDPVHTNTIWLGTGENASQRSAAYGDGVYKSTDGGMSWTNMGLKNSEHTGKILIDPRNPEVVYVAAQGPLWAAGGDRGLFKTTNGGKSWTNVLEISEHTGVSDIVFDPRNPDILYAASYQRRRHVGILVAGGPESAIYKSEDGGGNWKKLTNGIPAADKGRIALAISPINPDVVYALIASDKKNSGFFRSANQGERWEKRSDYIVVDPQYYGEIYADPHQFDRVYCMDVIIQVTDDGGKTFERQNTRHKHVDNHSLLFDAGDPDYLMIGCDGGIYETWDRGDSWRFVNNLPITQFYRVGIDNAEPFYNVYGGTQDNSTQGGPSRTTNTHGIRNSDWFITIGGDGFQTRVDPTDENILYSMYQYAGICRYDKRTGERVEIQPQARPGEAALRWHWDAPLIISPHNPQTLYFAAQRLFRSDDRGDSWTPISPDLSRNIDRNQIKVMGRTWSPEAIWKNVFTSPFGTIVSLSVSRLRNGLIVAGTDDGNIQVTSDGGQNWSRMSTFPGIPDRSYVSDVICSNHDENTIYALFNNHKSGDFKPYALKSTDLGKTWTSIAKSVPDRHVTWSIVEDHVDPNLLFLGTEFGLFFSIDGGVQWVQLKGGVPTIPFRDLEIQERENDLVGASFGRGFFIFDDYSPLRQLPVEKLASEPMLFPVKDALLYVPSNPLGSTKGSQGDAFYAAPNPDFGAILTYHLPKALSSKKQARKAAEKEALSAGKDIAYPSWEDLRAEDIEEAASIWIDITNAAGETIQRVKGAAGKGFHRVAWNLRYASSGTTGRRSRGGPFVVPGRYGAQLIQYKDGILTRLSEQRFFEVTPLGWGTLKLLDKAEALTFLKEVDYLQVVVNRTDGFIGEKLDEVRQLKTAFLRNGVPDDGLQLARSIEKKLLDMQLVLDGDETQSNRAEFILPGIKRQLNRVSGAKQTTYGPTKTHRQSFADAKVRFKALYGDLDRLTKMDLKDFYRMVQEADMPWAPQGTMPVWEGN